VHQLLEGELGPPGEEEEEEGVEKRRRLHRLQHGQCSYTFILPELDGGGGSHGAVVQRDSPPADGEWSAEKLKRLESTMENNTLWPLENSIQRNTRREAAGLQSHAVHNQTATMLEIGTNLLTHTAEQTRKLNVVEAKVLNHTSRIEIQLLENSLSTNKLEKELLLQTSEIDRLRDKNSVLESKVRMLESQQKGELEDMKEEKNRLQHGDQHHRYTHTHQHGDQPHRSTHTHQPLLHPFAAGSPRWSHMWKDCADVYRSGYSTSGLYHIYIGNRTEPVQVYCDMETSGGGWTVFQRRFNGSVDFQRGWGEYRTGFGDVFGEHWLGNEALYQLSSQGQYSLRVELRDWEGNSAYGGFSFTFKLHGTAGRQSSLNTLGTGFSTRDHDNDNCDHCKCALMLTGGWWFDACGFSNLNGIYYNVGHNIRKLNGIKWHHFRGPSYSLRSTMMMVRPYDF
uniref:Angiopoietin 4 n=1 Tax=Salarias fasciatus TaxID=181472 RepID=A0A672FJE6_SALFA